jgi:hypothetical protein
MSCSKKRKSIQQGFCTTEEATDEVNVVEGTTDKDRVMFGGFSIAKNVMNKINSAVDVVGVQQANANNIINAVSGMEGTMTFSSKTTNPDPADLLRNLLTIDLIFRGIKHCKENI